MMSEHLKVTMIQTSLHWEDIDENLKLFSEKISSLKEDTDIIVLPEMFSTGFSMNAAAHAETMDGKAMQWLGKTAHEKNCVVTGSLMIKEGEAFYNRLVWMKPDGRYEHYDKRHLFQLAQEGQTYTTGDKKLIVEYKGWKIHPLICYDLRFPVWSRRTKTNDYDVLLYVANWPERRVQAWNQLLIARAIENQCYVVGVNRVGNDGHTIYHSGESAVINYKGEVINNSCAHDACIETITLSKQELDDFRRQFPFDADADDFSIQV
jgi:predicted amidohydrolase